MRHRLAILTCALVLLAPAGALAQDSNPFDGQLPPAQQTPAPTPAPVDQSSQDDVGRDTLYAIGAALLVFFVAIGLWISRDARANLPEDERARLRGDQPRDAGPHKHEREAKAKARAKGRAQRRARKAHRKGKAKR